MAAWSEPTTCSHPPARLHSWTATDGVTCVACCDCGSVLVGGVTEAEIETALGRGRATLGKAERIILEADTVIHALKDVKP